MSIIAAFTPGINVEARIRRTNVTADEIDAFGRINIHSLTSNILLAIRYEHLSSQITRSKMLYSSESYCSINALLILLACSLEKSGS